MEVKDLEFFMVPLGFAVLVSYHLWLIITIYRRPKRTVIGVNAESRRQWVSTMISDPAKNGVLAVQTIRNNIMASTLMATTTITIGSLISVFVSSTSSTGKYRYIVLCFLVAFLCNVQSIRYYAHASFLVTLPDGEGRKEYLAAILNRGSLFWSLGLRAFYFTIPLFLWIFGPLSMFASCYLITFVLYFLDYTGSSKYDPYEYVQKEEANNNDIESVGQSRGVNLVENSSLQSPLLASHSMTSNLNGSANQN
ncbi:hypothetical protein IC582_029895 [Cucumis melo]|uniref:DUF599 domain-containing protein n=2 Tax=Cucumis melo TaxID=3656 RepID=A0A5D3BIS3_CUCMM|nr:uncharacterized protein LOC103500327 [Cucumis melo]TYJ99017.1 uncharacterized protein E5676_scaffold248G002210 [Cucumis melo var. makuwa]